MVNSGRTWLYGLDDLLFITIVNLYFITYFFVSMSDKAKYASHGTFITKIN